MAKKINKEFPFIKSWDVCNVKKLSLSFFLTKEGRAAIAKEKLEKEFNLPENQIFNLESAKVGSDVLINKKKPTTVIEFLKQQYD